ncbi:MULTISPECIES: tRNA uracil 4-sulfurtransferase ThiI [Lactobacillales]|uniref:tRNA uracil 4-sulfurtransferase ThiI n=1 Tax=Lactobacillales TaxID=186826 RepID=UPI00066124A9|nr:MULTISPECIES: tRNA uracil 4-sulfurtransferase ThiI [unclassified Carnobacterium]KAF3300853.1 tRNA 4-thiouridine(8) synthase ThiI [Carnobacterium sp. PL12RED10]KAF3305273.1 tRNA 4-thiouridine(8) synthase ThiI [Carnobacterium sp. PL17GRE32]HCT97809.1 tRNA 4-thiouridine(8) synthase ThiI [Aerococcus urinaeequi]
MKELIMIRYGELSTKGKNKRNFVTTLGRNIREALSEYPDIKINQQYDFMFMELNGAPQDEVLAGLEKVFGIQSFSPAIELERDFDSLKEAAVKLVKAEIAKNGVQSFKVATSRSDHNYSMDTNDINQALGGFLAEEFPELKVQMKKPDLTIRVKVREQDFLVSSEWINGAGGLPVGTSANAVLMLSGGIDSPVAGYLAMKRGMRITAVHFASPPYTSPQALNKAKDLTEKLTKFGGWINFVEVPFTETQEAIKEHVNPAYLMTITRRMMMRISDELRKQYNGLAIINGESIGQVASQTLESMFAINEVTSTPIIRPVVAMDKLEIIDISQKIDTFDLSIQPFEDCCTVFAPPSPKTKPKLDDIAYYEAKLDIEGLVQRAVEGAMGEKIMPGSRNKEDSDAFSELL